MSLDPDAGASPAFRTEAMAGDVLLSPQQRAFYDCFGFIHLAGIFANEIDVITEQFEQVFAAEKPWELNEDLHFNERRQVVPNIVEHSPVLKHLVDDPRTVDIVTSLIGTSYQVGVSDGSIFSCDTSWHSDMFGNPLESYNLKLSFYLDELTGVNGAIRMIPGTNHWTSTYATSLRRDLNTPTAIESTFGVGPESIPSWTLETRPGDVVAWNFRTIHASFNGGERRRLLSLNFRRNDAATAEA